MTCRGNCNTTEHMTFMILLLLALSIPNFALFILCKYVAFKMTLNFDPKKMTLNSRGYMKNIEYNYTNFNRFISYQLMMIRK